MKPFSKLHEKIQLKYDEMQKKIEKSKSVDAIISLNDEYNYKDKKYVSCENLCGDNEIKKHGLMKTVVVEEVATYDARSREIERENSVAESLDEFMIIEQEEIEREYNEMNKPTSNFNYSLESLNEIADDSDTASIPSISPKISIRDRINSKLLARRERRKAEKENATKNNNKKKETREKVEKFILSNTTKHEFAKTFKKGKVASLTIALIEAIGLDPDVGEDKLRFMVCRLKLGSEKYKSKLIKTDKTVVKWQELFHFNMFDENMFEITLWDKDAFIGRSTIDLLELEKEKTHQMRLDMECETGNAQLFILLTITGTVLANTLVDLDDYQETQRRLSTFRKKLAWYHISKSEHVGWCSIIVYGAKGLSGNECYCIVELNNERLLTHTDSKTNDPNWMKIFTFIVKDITSILEITIHDEKKSEDVGKLSIPLLNMNNGKKWYALKDVTQRERAKGNNPRILLESKVTWNILRASMRAINPKEEKYLELDDKLARHIFARNLSRAKAVLEWIMSAFRIIKTCFEWESTRTNLFCLTMWLLFCWFFRIWMLPLLLLLPFLRYSRPAKYRIGTKTSMELESSKKDKEEKTSLRQKINSLQEMIQSVQNFIGSFASLGESIKNLFNFTVPFLSIFAIIMISIISLVMYLIPVKYLFMIWGIHKFTRKILRPNRIPNNEMLDLLSRVPDDETLLNIQELPLEEMPEEDICEI